MRRKGSLKLWTCTGGVVLAGMAIANSARAQILTGNLTTTGVNYGEGASAPFTGQLATQTVTTAFGASSYTASPGPEANGSELDAAYGASANGYLYLFFAGNIQDNGNLLNVFIQAGSNGSNTLDAPNGAGTLQNMNGSIFSPGFAPTYAFEINDNNPKGTSPHGTSTAFYDQFNLTTGGIASFIGSVPLTTGIGASQNIDNSGIELAINNSNISVMGATPGLAFSNTSAQSVATGVEVGIPLSTLGNPVSGSVEVMADLNGGSDGGVSNEALPGLNVGNVDIKKAPGVVVDGVTNVNPEYVSTNTKQFTFANTPGEFFTVSVPVTPGIWIPTGGGTWNSAANWTDSSIPNTPNSTASFSNASTASIITLDGSRTVGEVNFNNSNSYTISPGTGGSLIMQSVTGSAAITDNAGNHTISAPIVLNSNTTVTEESNGNIFTLSGNISGTGSLTTAGEAINTRTMTVSDIVLSGSNSYTGGTEILRGNLQLGSANALPAGSSLTLDGLDSPQGTLDLDGFSPTVSSLTVNAGGAGNSQIVNTDATPGTATFTYAGSIGNPSTYPGTISDSSSTSGNVTALSVLSGSLTLTGTNTYAGGTTIAPGASLQIASAGDDGTALLIGSDVVNNGSLIINDVLTGAGTISGSGATTIEPTSVVVAAGFDQPGGLVNNGISLEVLGPAVIGPISGSGELIIDSSLQLVGGPSTIASLSLGSSATMDLNGNSVTIGAIPNSSGAIIGNSSTTSGGTLVYAGVSDTLSANIQDGFNGAGDPVALSVATGALLVNGSNTYSGGTSIASGASLTIGAAGALPTARTVVDNGSLTFNASSTVGNLSGSGALTVSSGIVKLQDSSGVSTQSSLSIASGSSLDLSNNEFILTYGAGADPITTILSYLTDGYNSGWTAGEIYSSSVANADNTQSQLKYEVGYADGADGLTLAVPSGEIEILPTLAGDAKLQGNVVFGDFQVLAQYFGQAGGWDQGDFTYSGLVSFGDFQLLAQDFGSTDGGLTAGELASLNNFAAQFGDRLVANANAVGFQLVSVPEPATAGLLAAAGIGLLGRRRRRR
jgi:fibronectin-binding autotransporter adhesin